MNNTPAQAADSRLVLRLFLRLLPYQVLFVAAGAVNGIVSGYFASNYVGSDAVSAINLYSPVSLFLTAISNMLFIGSQAVCGKYLGKNQLQRAQHIFSQDLLAALLLALGITAVLAIAPLAGLTGLFTRDEAVLADLNPYVLGQAVGVLPLLLGQQMVGFLSLENRSRRTTLASVILIFVNLALNCLLVAVLKLGPFGLALASSLGMWVYFGVQAQYYIRGKSLLRLSRALPKLRDLAEIVKTGYQGALSYVYLSVRTAIVNALVALYVGSAGLSALGASGMVLGLFWTIPTGVVNTARMLISISVGEEDRKSLVHALRVATYVGTLVTSLFCACLMLCAEPVTRLFFRDPADPVYGMTVMALRIMPLCMPPTIISQLFYCYSQVCGKQLRIQLLSLLDQGINVAAFSALLLPIMGMNGNYVANVLNGIACILLIAAISCFLRRRFPRSLEALMVVPDEFGASGDERIDITVRRMADVTAVSGMVIDFCQGRGIDARRTFVAGLSLEEMAGNVVEHGFHEDDKPHSVDIRVVHRGDNVILRIRDDCKPFDPLERMQQFEPADPCKGVGLRLVLGMATDIKYQNLLGLNVLTINI